ncbi:DUF429 domain-containing protein [Halobacillus naozhouensis]|uniref:DUF429 domain-containing protein n=1 Tax=Halobacillus naozhouensis TaxID=554880 RepID=A0ABY8IWJ4_9BACI|nr:DUF429 domain-containing protein [Halobacillus naozhouensis]WFT74594.1 DUF429 domain-containing protein [Halobacillus naozhouensis]
MFIVGIDLSGPANHKDTAVAVFQSDEHSLHLDQLLTSASDDDILTLITHLSERNRVHVGIDAPLSYQDGGGDRPLDKRLRQFTKELGMKPGSIMPPTLTKMIYLTARGMKIASMLTRIPNVEVIEVHPGASLAARVPQDKAKKHIVQYKNSSDSLEWIADWMISFGLSGIRSDLLKTSHLVDACAAAIAAWDYGHPKRNSYWMYDSVPPHHPCPFSC